MNYEIKFVGRLVVYDVTGTAHSAGCHGAVLCPGSPPTETAGSRTLSHSPPSTVTLTRVDTWWLDSSRLSTIVLNMNMVPGLKCGEFGDNNHSG